MIQWLRNLASRPSRPSDPVGPAHPRGSVRSPASGPVHPVPGAGRRFGFAPVRAKYDAAQTTPENRRHWAAADHLSANAAANPDVRRVLRSRARYEVANNGYARGLVNTLANYVIGTGPRLQMLTDDPKANRIIEREFARWAKAVRLPERLWTMRVSQCESGEVFAMLLTNPRVDSPVKLDLRLVETEQVASPLAMRQDAAWVEGIRFDAWGNPASYCVLRRHPGDRILFGVSQADDYDLLPADLVIHLFRADRPGQRRGVPEVTSSLSLFALLRRYSLAVLSAAEHAALPGGVIYTDAPADSEAATVEPMDQVEMDRGTWLTMPYGWKVGQIRAEQPTTMYGDYTSKVLNEIARPLNMPFNIASGNSSGYNYASGRLDHQSFYRSIRIDQQRVGDVVLDHLLRAWMHEAVLIEGLLPDSVRTLEAAETGYPHQWFWDGTEHVDPAKEANAQARRLANHTTTLAAEYAKCGLDWESELRQRAKELALMNELGLTLAESAPNAPSSTPSKPDADPEESDDESRDDEPDSDAADDAEAQHGGRHSHVA